MTDTIDNGRTALADFAFFTGRVGVRDREDYIEAAYFGRTRNVRLPADGTLDGEAVRAIEIQSRPVRAGAALRAITLTIVRES